MNHRADVRLLAELEPEVERLLGRHLSMAEEWFPHDYVPYSLGRDFDTQPWTPDQPRLTGAARVAFEVNLLTEDNLPSYHREVHTLFGGKDSAWMQWVHRWTAEESRHATVLRDYLLVTRNTDPYQLERDRMATMSTGFNAGDKDTWRVLSYVAFQELATRICHRNTGRHSEDPVADRIMARIATDENLHMVFYRDVLAAALHVDPSTAVKAIALEVMDFQMPGAGMPSFTPRAVEIAKAGIYDLRIHHDQVIWPLLRYWDFFGLKGLDDEAEKARIRTAEFLQGLDRMAARYEQKRADQEAKEARVG